MSSNEIIEKNDLYLSLSNISNYKKTYEHSCEDVFNIFSLIINNYFDNCVKTIYINDKKYLYYVIENGLNTLYNVFSIIYLYSKNLELTKQYTERGYYIYCEFIGKIGENNHKFLQLNSTNATLFVLKKTIYELNNNYTRTFETTQEEQTHINNIKCLSDVYIKCIKLHLQVDYSIHSFITSNNEYKLKDIHNTNTGNERRIEFIKIDYFTKIKRAILDNIQHNTKHHLSSYSIINSLSYKFDTKYEKQKNISFIQDIGNLISSNNTDKLNEEKYIDSFIDRFNEYLCKTIASSNI